MNRITNSKDMEAKIQSDWTIFCEEAQKNVEQEYIRIGNYAKDHSLPDFIKQSCDRIIAITESVSNARVMKNQRLDDVDAVFGVIQD